MTERSELLIVTEERHREVRHVLAVRQVEVEVVREARDLERLEADLCFRVDGAYNDRLTEAI